MAAFNPVEHKLPGEFVYRGVRYCFVNKNVDIHMTDSWTADPCDILIATYPKAGICTYITYTE